MCAVRVRITINKMLIVCISCSLVCIHFISNELTAANAFFVVKRKRESERISSRTNKYVNMILWKCLRLSNTRTPSNGGRRSEDDGEFCKSDN